MNDIFEYILVEWVKLSLSKELYNFKREKDESIYTIKISDCIVEDFLGVHNLEVNFDFAHVMGKYDDSNFIRVKGFNFRKVKS